MSLIPICRHSILLMGRCRQAVYVYAACIIIGAVLQGCGQEESNKETVKKFEIEKEYKRGPVTFTVRIDKKEITIADRLKLELEVRSSGEYDVKLPEFGDKLEQFGIVDYNAPPAVLGKDDVVITKKSYVLEPFLSGDYTIPSMNVTFSKKDADDGKPQKEHELESGELTVKVKSLLPEKAKDLAIRDSVQPVDLPRHTGAAVYWFIGALGAAVCCIAGILLLRRRHVQKQETIRRSAHEIAYEELRRLVAQDLIEKGMVKAFHTGLSDILRRYIENRFGLHAPERTTEEFLDELRSSSVLAESHKELLKGFLVLCDMVKFAEHQPESAEMQKAFDACRKFIAETEQKQETVPVSKEAVSEGAVSNAV